LHLHSVEDALKGESSMPTLIRRPRKVKPASGVTTLILSINGISYQVLRLQPHPEVAAVAFRLRKGDGAVYDVAQTAQGAQCSCPDFIFNRDGKDPAGCKHIKAMRAWGLLPG
jgi:hypothetical protein